MSITTKRLCSGLLSGSNATLYTAPAGTGNYTIVKALTLCNNSDAAVTANISLAGVSIIGGYGIAARDMITIPFLDQILQNGETIAGYAGTTDLISYYISGKEVT